MLRIKNHDIDINGILIEYQEGKQHHSISFGPAASCCILMDMGIIRGFTIDENGEPVVAVIDTKKEVENKALEPWHVFVGKIDIETLAKQIVRKHKTNVDDFFNHSFFSDHVEVKVNAEPQKRAIVKNMPYQFHIPFEARA